MGNGLRSLDEKVFTKSCPEEARAARILREEEHVDAEVGREVENLIVRQRIRNGAASLFPESSRRKWTMQMLMEPFQLRKLCLLK